MTLKQFVEELKEMHLYEEKESTETFIKIGAMEDSIEIVEREAMIERMIDYQLGWYIEVRERIKNAKTFVVYERWQKDFALKAKEALRVDQMVLELCEEGEYYLLIGNADIGMNIGNELFAHCDRSNEYLIEEGRVIES